jgi:flagellar biosynthesis activator protein FlaF
LNALDLARQGYARPNMPTRSPRDVEYDLLARMTRRLVAAWDDRGQNFGTLVQALHDNQAMWQTFALDVADAANGLPQALRAKLYYLFEFTAQHSPKVREGTASVEVLVDINRAVMRGLRGDGAAA